MDKHCLSTSLTGPITCFCRLVARPYSDTRDYRLPSGNPLRKAHATPCRRAGIRDFKVHDWRHHWAAGAGIASGYWPATPR
jgi:integrase